jgi:hypothetical protein
MMSPTSKIYEEPNDDVIQTPSNYQVCVTKCASKHISCCSIVIKIKTSVPSYVKVNHHLQMALQLSSQVSSNFIVQPAVSSHVLIFQRHPSSLNIVFFLKKWQVQTLLLCFMIKRNAIRKIRKKGLCGC